MENLTSEKVESKNDVVLCSYNLCHGTGYYSSDAITCPNCNKYVYAFDKINNITGERMLSREEEIQLDNYLEYADSFQDYDDYNVVCTCPFCGEEINNPIAALPENDWVHIDLVARECPCSTFSKKFDGYIQKLTYSAMIRAGIPAGFRKTNKLKNDKLNGFVQHGNIDGKRSVYINTKDKMLGSATISSILIDGIKTYSDVYYFTWGELLDTLTNFNSDKREILDVIKERVPNHKKHIGIDFAFSTKLTDYQHSRFYELLSSICGVGNSLILVSNQPINNLPTDFKNLINDQCAYVGL